MTKKSKSKNLKTNKALKIGIPITAVVLLIGISLAVMLGSSTRVAFLNIETGNVEVDNGKGWISATDGMKLSEDDSVRTLDGTAILVLYESIIVQMEENTEIAISDLSKKHIKLDQKSGSTWNKFASIMGIKGFEVETPTTVATVRGTEFWVDMDSIGVSAGQVNVQMEGKSMLVKAGNKAISPDRSAKVVPLTEAERVKAIAKKEIVIKQLKELRQQEIEKHKTIYNIVKRLNGWDDSEINRRLDKLDRGDYDVEAVKRNAPIPSQAIDKFTALSEEILKNTKQVQSLKTGSYAPVKPVYSESKVMNVREPEVKQMPPDPLANKAIQPDSLEKNRLTVQPVHQADTIKRADQEENSR